MTNRKTYPRRNPKPSTSKPKPKTNKRFAYSKTGKWKVGCGGDRDRTKRPLMGRAVSRFADLIVLTSDNPRSEDPEAIIQDILSGIDNQLPVTIEVDRKKAIKQALYLMEKGDVLIIAGKGHETYQEIGGKRYPFCDRDVVEEIVNSWN